MQWMTGKGWACAYGVSWGYLVVHGETGVRLSRFSVDLAAENLTAALAAETMRNVIVFPLGRGPGRPGGEPELAALMEAAKTYAERYEVGESLEGYPAWQQPIVTKTGRVLTDADTEALADEAEHGYDVRVVARRHASGDQADAALARAARSAVAAGEPLVSWEQVREESGPDFTTDDRAVVARVKAFDGHIQDMPEDERLYLLGYLASAVERLLGDDHGPVR